MALKSSAIGADLSVMFKLSLRPLPALFAAGMRALVLGGGILEGDTDADVEVRLVSNPVRGLGRRFLAIWAGGGEPPPPRSWARQRWCRFTTSRG